MYNVSLTYSSDHEELPEKQQQVGHFIEHHDPTGGGQTHNLVCYWRSSRTNVGREILGDETAWAQTLLYFSWEA